MIAGLILAAGQSSRMGQHKALLAYRGRTFLENIVATLREAGVGKIAVILGHQAEEIQRVVDLEGVEVVVNRDYPQGQTSSLQAGLRALSEARWEHAVAAASPPSGARSRSGDEDIAATESRGDLGGILLCLVDHPAVSAETIRILARSFYQSHAPVTIPTFQSRRGHPVVIARGLFDELLRLGPGEGANTVIRKYREVTKFEEVDDRGILLDVDDADAYRQLSE